ncbi:pyridoxal-dependent decarboxylase [Parafrankia colletiae]|uniref:Pyridoxal-dependent decarboxylase n=1 Tax=Parafrankia colletiae TaxID=573497 RepID=A0A1S1QNK6_9ACTN|nr:pyridoxal-dependent decarboxylase [Parafrankia colletiae]MCK9901385.1 aminotransferase class V-fold PLP-dependent enzyme [Frankia sp. Cpl3]OHV36318.1 pyridoxal-dependent decarboxylase [Parafrankia colletiae]
MTRPGHRPADDLRALLAVTVDALDAGRRDRSGPLPSGGPVDVRKAVLAALGEPGPLLPPTGDGEAAALGALTRMLSAGSADPADPLCAAHLHCPPLTVAVAADLAVSALNPSLDSWDQAPAGTTIEAEVLAALAGLVGYDPSRAVGTVTTGGTESNLMGLLLGGHVAGRAAAPAPGSTAVSPRGWLGQLPHHRRHGARTPAPRPAAAAALPVFCSAAGHHSVRRGAELLGLRRIVPVGVDVDHRMDVQALRSALARHPGPALVVATAGTTDAGAIDPLAEIAELVRAHPAPVWLHVDAAHGGGALFSRRLAERLAGLAQADSVALDLHKLGWQPAPAGIFLTPSERGWDRLDAEVAYLNPADETIAGYTSLLGRSLRTTRRPDAFKIAVTFRALGRERLGAMVDTCHDLARHAARVVAADPRLELAAPVTLSTVLFRYLPPEPGEYLPPEPGEYLPPEPGEHPPDTGGGAPEHAGVPPLSGHAGRLDRLDRLNAAIRSRLLEEGTAVVGRTTAGPHGAVHLKLTLLNPNATDADVSALLALVAETGDQLAAERTP